jgi:hypothetical protein
MMDANTSGGHNDRCPRAVIANERVIDLAGNEALQATDDVLLA